MNIITIFIDCENIDLNNSLLLDNENWKFNHKEFFTKNERGPFENTSLSIFSGGSGYYNAGKSALLELIRIIKIEKLILNRINYHYSYFYKDQCNIEFDNEYIRLFAELNCYVTISCSKN